MTTNNEIHSLRDQIDQINNDLTDLLLKRFELVRKIGSLKGSSGHPFFDPSREERMMDKIKKRISNIGLDEKIPPADEIRTEAVLHIFRHIFHESLTVMQAQHEPKTKSPHHEPV